MKKCVYKFHRIAWSALSRAGRVRFGNAAHNQHETNATAANLFERLDNPSTGAIRFDCCTVPRTVTWEGATDNGAKTSRKSLPTATYCGSSIDGKLIDPSIRRSARWSE